ncbi:MAG: hypothetical protein SVZ03_14625 [Spirochaetota bacterium]|nr:hypothetical protein [Spirochaetota bacterium]
MNVEDDIDDLLSDIEGESDFEDKGEDMLQGGSVLTGSQIALTPDGSVDELLGEDIENKDNDTSQQEDSTSTDTENMTLSLDERAVKELADSDELHEISKGERKLSSLESVEGEKSSSEERPATSFIIKGTRSWNTREPYIAVIEKGKLSKDYKDLGISVYFYHDINQTVIIKREINEAIVQYIRRGSKGISDQYGEFIYKTLFYYVQQLCDFFDIPRERLFLFAFHIGVLNLYRILIEVFNNSMLGHCYKLIPGKRVARYVPSEFIKERVLSWHDDNISILDLPFDGIHEFEEIKKGVSRKYYSEVDRFNEKINNEIKQLKPEPRRRFNRDDFMKSRWIEWFGIDKIVVYKRFVERTIFKY